MFDHWLPSGPCSSAATQTTRDTAGYLDAVHFEFSITPTTAVLKVQNGDVDLLGDYIPPSDYPGLIANPQWKSQVVTGLPSRSTVCL